MTKKIIKKSNFEILKVTQTGSSIGRKYNQELVLIGLGLNKMHKTVHIEATPSNMGMIDKVRHLLKIESANS